MAVAARRPCTCVTVTVPGRATRPRSLRPRSTSITCSARSLGSRWSCSARIASSARRGATRPRAGDRVGRELVALDLERAAPGSRRRPRTTGVRTKNRYGLGLTRRRPRYSPMPSSCWPSPGRSAGRTTGAGPGRPGSPRRRRSRPWRPRRRGCTRRGRGSSAVALGAGRARRGRAAGARRAGRAGQLGGRRPRGPLERLEDRLLGDPVAALEIRRLGVQRRDRRERVGQVVEDEDEVGFDERRRRRPTGSASGSGHASARSRHGVVGQRPDGAAGEPGHPLGRLDPPARHERRSALERIGRRRWS